MIYRFAEYELDTGLFELRKAGEPQRLEPQVFDVLTFLVQNHDRLVTKDELLEQVWGDKYISEAALNSRLMAARRAIGDSGREQRWIRTQYGRGFRFVGPVTIVEASAASPAVRTTEELQRQELTGPEAAPAAQQPAPAVLSPPRRPDDAGRRSRLLHSRLLAGASLLLVTGIGLGVYFSMPDEDGSAAPPLVEDCALPAGTATAASHMGAITFTAQSGGRNAVHRVNFDGSGLALAYDDPLFDSDARWSPDGKRLVFTSRAAGNRDIYVATPGQPPLRLTHDPSDELEPTWSPDGSLLAFTSGKEGQKDIFLMTPEGAMRGRVTSDPADDFHPAWSPDGSWLAFASTRAGNRDVYLVRSDGSCLVRLTDHGQDDDQPAWSPEGRVIAFQSRRDGNREIYTIGVDGQGLARLTNDQADDRQPAWSPDGSFLAFVSTRNSVRQIFVVQANGVGLRILLDTPGDKDQPAWLPAAP